MMSNHTPEPWFWESVTTFYQTEDRGEETLAHLITAGAPMPDESYWIAYVPGINDEDIANARRIVACVNLCRGLSTKQLEYFNRLDLPLFDLICRAIWETAARLPDDTSIMEIFEPLIKLIGGYPVFLEWSLKEYFAGDENDDHSHHQNG